MELTSSTTILLLVGALVLCCAAVVVDRINFAQKKFVPKKVDVDGVDVPQRDRTGAHFSDLADDAGSEDSR